MAERGGGRDAGTGRRRKHKNKNKHTPRNAGREKLLFNLKWMCGGLAVGLPLLAAVIFVASR